MYVECSEVQSHTTTTPLLGCGSVVYNCMFSSYEETTAPTISNNQPMSFMDPTLLPIQPSHFIALNPSKKAHSGE